MIEKGRGGAVSSGQKPGLCRIASERGNTVPGASHEYCKHAIQINIILKFQH